MYPKKTHIIMWRKEAWTQEVILAINLKVSYKAVQNQFKVCRAMANEG